MSHIPAAPDLYVPDDPTSYEGTRRGQQRTYGSKGATHQATGQTNRNTTTQGQNALDPRDESNATRQKRGRSSDSVRLPSPNRSRRRSPSPSRRSTSRRSRSLSSCRLNSKSPSPSRHSRSHSRGRSRARSQAQPSNRPVSASVKPINPDTRRAFEDTIDELTEQVAECQSTIASLKTDVASLKVVEGLVASIRGEVKPLRDEVVELRAFVDQLVTMIKSGANTATLATVIDSLKPAIREGTPDVKPGTKKRAKAGDEYTDTDRRKIVDHARRTLFRMMGISVANEVPDPIKNDDGTYNFWFTLPDGKQLLRPAWGTKLGPNSDPQRGWINEFITECQSKPEMKSQQGFLSTVKPQVFVEVMETACWQTLHATWKNKSGGKLDERMAQKQVNGQEYHRKSEKANNRDGAMEGTTLAIPGLKFNGNRHYQSPEHSDVEDSNRKCIDEPCYRSEIANKLADSLSYKHRLGVKKVSPATRTNVVYYKSNLPIPMLGNYQLIPRWAVSEEWINKNPKQWANSQYRIDMNDSTPPDVAVEFVNQFVAPPRSYVAARPTPSKAASKSVVPKLESPPHSEFPSRATSPAEGQAHEVGPANPNSVPEWMDPTLESLEREGSQAPPLRGGQPSSTAQDAQPVLPAQVPNGNNAFPHPNPQIPLQPPINQPVDVPPNQFIGPPRNEGPFLPHAYALHYYAHEYRPPNAHMYPMYYQLVGAPHQPQSAHQVPANYPPGVPFQPHLPEPHRVGLVQQPQKDESLAMHRAIENQANNLLSTGAQSQPTFPGPVPFASTATNPATGTATMATERTMEPKATPQHIAGNPAPLPNTSTSGASVPLSSLNSTSPLASGSTTDVGGSAPEQPAPPTERRVGRPRKEKATSGAITNQTRVAPADLDTPEGAVHCSERPRKQVIR